MPLSGDKVFPDDTPGGLIWQYARKTSSTTNSTTTEVGFVNSALIAVRAGWSYRASWLRPIPSYTTSASSAICRIRGSQSGTAVVGSTLLDGGEGRVLTPANTSNGEEQLVQGIWECTSSGNLSLWFGFQRADGSGTVTMFGSTGSFSKFILEEIGQTQTNSGTDL